MQDVNVERGTCVKCHLRPQRENHHWCVDCHNANMRHWRKTHKLQGDARFKMRSRSYANVYQRRGKLIPQPCEVFGCSEEAQKHHEDYSKPLAVQWLCRKHHMELHNAYSTSQS